MPPTKTGKTSYDRLYTTLSKRISFLLRTPWRCTPRSAEGIPLGSSVMRFGPSAGCLVKDRGVRSGLLQQERMFLMSRFAFRAHPNRPQAAYRTLVLADTAAGASLGIYPGGLEPDLQDDFFQIGGAEF